MLPNDFIHDYVVIVMVVVALMSIMLLLLLLVLSHKDPIIHVDQTKSDSRAMAGQTCGNLIGPNPT